MKVGYFQFNPQFGQLARNTDQICRVVSEARTDLLVLPELAISGYYFRDHKQALDYAEVPEASPHVEQVIHACAAAAMHVVVGFAERDGDQVYNSALLIGPDGLKACYRKLHLFNTEKKCFDPGNEPPPVINIGGARIGLMICFDWIFPEVARSLALRGAQIIAHPSNLVIPVKCQQAMPVRCTENRVFAVTCNRWGEERHAHGAVSFTGESMLVQPDGTVLHRAPVNRDELYVVDVEPTDADDKQINPENHLLQDRRIEFYQ